MITPNEQTRKRIEKKIKEGRGQGFKSEYKPWLEVNELSSRGTSHRVYSSKTNRVSHLLSNLENCAFNVFVWADCVEDIREQYPLLPIESTLQIAEKMGIKHPSFNDKQNGQLLTVMTTDFLVTEIDPDSGTKRDHAFSVKMASDLNNARVREKLDIEAEYWNQQGVQFHILTERELISDVVKAIEAVNSCADQVQFQKMSSEWHRKHFTEFVQLLQEFPTRNLTELANKFDLDHNMPSGESLNLLFFWISQKRLPINLNAKLPLQMNQVKDIVPMEELERIISTEGGGQNDFAQCSVPRCGQWEDAAGS